MKNPKTSKAKKKPVKAVAKKTAAAKKASKPKAQALQANPKLSPKKAKSQKALSNPKTGTSKAATKVSQGASPVKAKTPKKTSVSKATSAKKSSAPKIGIFGGTFNPFHNGHANSIISVKAALGLDRMFVIPSAQNPLKSPIEGPTAEQRLEMVRLGVEGLGENIEVLDLEIQRGGMSYTFETLYALRKKHKVGEFYLVVGADTLNEFHKWKNFAEIFSLTHLVVTTRPGHELPRKRAEFPEGVRDWVKDVATNGATLITGKQILFVELSDIDVSATDLRKQTRIGMDAIEQMPLAVWNYIQENGLYRQLTNKISDFSEFTRFCSRILFNQKGIAVKGYDLRDLDAPTEFTLIASGTSTRHTAAIAENVVRQVKLNYGVHPLSAEGTTEGRWVVLDYGALIIHVFYDYVRQEYRIEDLWKNGRDMELKDPTAQLKQPSRVSSPVTASGTIGSSTSAAISGPSPTKSVTQRGVKP